MRAIVADTRTSAPTAAPARAVRLRPPRRRIHTSSTLFAPEALHITDDLRLVDPRSPYRGTLVAERGREDFGDSSHVRTNAQSSAGLESSRARAPYMAGGEFSPATVLRAGALKSKRPRSLPAYGAQELAAQRLTQPYPPTASVGDVVTPTIAPRAPILARHPKRTDPTHEHGPLSVPAYQGTALGRRSQP